MCEILPLIPTDPILDPIATVKSLFVTEAHLVMRFDMYSRYPTALWSLTRKYNSNGFALEISKFLFLPERFLDTGYSFLLQQEAWAQGSEADAAGYLMSETVQNEIVGIFENTPANGLEVERKHNQDKRAETTKVKGCARASRDSILRRYSVYREQRLAEVRKGVKRKQAATHLNLQSLAVQKNPELFSRARGKLRWQQGVSKRDSRQIVHQGDSAALKQYIAENRDELKAELLRRQEEAKYAVEVEKELPLSVDEWLSFLGDNEDMFREQLRGATSRRSGVSERIKPRTDLEGVSRVYPQVCREHGHAPHWSHLEAGFFCFKANADHLLVVFLAVIGYTVYACPLTATAVRGDYEYLLADSFHEVFRPIGLILDAAGLPDSRDLPVYSLDIVPHEFAKDRVVFRVVGAERVPPPVRTTNPGGAASSSGSKFAEEAPEIEKDFAQELVDKMLDDGSECDSMCSSEDSEQSSDMCESDDGSELAQQESGVEGDQEEDRIDPRAVPGTHVMYSNGYFTFTNNPAYKDIKVRVVSRWCTKEFLGTTEMSKTIIPENYGDKRSDPARAFLCLQAWMIWKSKKNQFCDGRANRRQLFAEEAAKLRASIVAMSSPEAPTTGNDMADDFIRRHAPGALAKT